MSDGMRRRTGRQDQRLLRESDWNRTMRLASAPRRSGFLLEFEASRMSKFDESRGLDLELCHRAPQVVGFRSTARGPQ